MSCYKALYGIKWAQGKDSACKRGSKLEVDKLVENKVNCERIMIKVNIKWKKVPIRERIFRF